MSTVTKWHPYVLNNLFGELQPLIPVATDDSAFILNNGKTVAIPNAGTLPTITIGRTTGYPANATARADVDNTYNLEKIEIDPIVIHDFEESTASYDKAGSVIEDATKGLGWSAARYIMTQWWLTDTTNDYATTGSVTYASQALGSTVTNAKALSYSDIVKLGNMLDKMKVPRDQNRWLVLNASMYNSLFLELKAADQVDLATRSAMTGLLDWIHGFKILMLPETVNATTGNGAVRPPDNAGTTSDISCGFALHSSAVSLAVSDVKIFDEPVAPEYYGRVISGIVYAGGKYRRTDKKGVITIYEGV